VTITQFLIHADISVVNVLVAKWLKNMKLHRIARQMCRLCQVHKYRFIDCIVYKQYCKLMDQLREGHERFNMLLRRNRRDPTLISWSEQEYKRRCKIIVGNKEELRNLCREIVRVDAAAKSNMKLVCAKLNSQVAVSERKAEHKE